MPLRGRLTGIHVLCHQLLCVCLRPDRRQLGTVRLLIMGDAAMQGQRFHMSCMLACKPSLTAGVQQSCQHLQSAVHISAQQRGCILGQVARSCRMTGCLDHAFSKALLQAEGVMTWSIVQEACRTCR